MKENAKKRNNNNFKHISGNEYENGKKNKDREFKSK